MIKIGLSMLASYTPFALASGDPLPVFYYLGGAVQLVVLLVLAIWSGRHRIKFITIYLLNLGIIWSFPWPGKALASYYMLLLAEPIFCLILMLVIARFIDKASKDRADKATISSRSDG